MNAVKYFLCCLLTTFILLSAVGGGETAFAAGRYARADSRDIYFCDKKDLNAALFTIPYTYCVEVISTDGDWYYVKYAEDAGIYRAMYGYCLKEHLTIVDEPPENIYLYMPVTVTYKADSSAGSLPVLNELTVTAAFYGTYYSGASAYSYVLYEDSFGYIYGANDGYPLNELPAEEPPAEEPKKDKESSNSKVLIAVILAGLAVAAIVILYFAGKKSKYYKP